MLTVNLNVEQGLFNGSPGTMKDILYPKGRNPSEGFPTVLMVNFPKYTGPAFIPSHPQLIPVVPVERRLDCGCCKRRQVPLRLGWGTTIHRCQGMTIGEGQVSKYIIINPGTKGLESRCPGILYVALSRAKTSGNACCDPGFAFHESVLLNEDRICHKPQTYTMKMRKQEIERLYKLSNKTKEIFGDLTTQESFDRLINKIYGINEE